ncbi:hypothetical protein Patl1_33614 [Pistacia atlantica]|uniref:Uncharacterized protein n=1 Tax=Pistacia atlantica TaxID=434234 RepID=A0ACC0ZTQ0_9ROSI|nr:hypothetical protein Patl1_33614 [Pistacia atlantica]
MALQQFTETAQLQGICKILLLRQPPKLKALDRPTKKSKAALKKEAKSHAALLSSTTYDWSKKVMKYKSNNYENIRGNLIVVATLIAAMSFQVATNPPGGDWKSDVTNKKDQNCTIGAVNCIFKTSINEYTHDKLVFFSTLSFSASLSIILWLISGVPLKNRVSVGILLIGMWATVLFVAATYYLYISLAMPHDSQDQYDHVFDFISVWYLWLWAGLLAVIIAIHTLRFCWWVVKKLFMGVVYIVRCCCCCCCYKNKKNQHHDQIMCFLPALRVCNVIILLEFKQIKQEIERLVPHPCCCNIADTCKIVLPSRFWELRNSSSSTDATNTFSESK